MIQPQLAQKIHKLVADIPQELVNGLVSAVVGCEDGQWKRMHAKVDQTINQPGIRQHVTDFLHEWEVDFPEVTVEAITLAMLTAAQIIEYNREAQKIEIVWTGPDSQIIPLRRNNQALLELIRSAQKTLHIVSFTVYKAEEIRKAIVEAAQRGVSISLYLETPEDSAG
ncbi:MAG: hypothetical protein KC496_22125, partial [Anaerolineae bacterium]|nr:hypothetical protein [Anaerolineae bacterium]